MKSETSIVAMKPPVKNTLEVFLLILRNCNQLLSNSLLFKKYPAKIKIIIRIDRAVGGFPAVLILRIN
jgi:hypothetical protein